ncbi:MAG TPA: hypothetical protein VK849_13905, partial [Longimicrobiales bacterium]|nr:hypothetical protein [Longimicrobiales bacterium]
LSEVARTDRTSTVAYFPQGRIRPDDPRPLDFLPGVSAVASALSPATVLPVGLRLLPGRTRRIEAFVSIGDPILVRGHDTVTPGLIEAAVAEELDAIRAFLRTHGEDAPEQWPADGHALPRPVHRFRRIVGVATRLSRN